MSDPWAAPPSADELKAAGWDTPPTPQEIAAAGSAAPAAAEAPEIKPVPSEGAPASVRAAASLPITEQGKLDYIKSKYGAGNVVSTKGGTILFRNGPDDSWKKFRGNGINWGDVASLAGPTLEAVPAIAGMALGPGGAAIGGVAGNALRQAAGAAVGETIPRSPTATAKDPELALLKSGDTARGRATEALAAGVLSQAGNTAVSALGKGFNYVKDLAKSGEAAKALYSYVERLADKIGGGAAQTSAEAGDALVKAHGKLMDNLLEQRATEAKALFDAVPKDANIPLPATRQAIEDLISRHSGIFQSDAGKALVSKLQGWKRSLPSSGVTAHDMQVALHDFGDYAAKGGIVDNMAASDAKKAGQKLFSALNQDLDAAAVGDASSKTQGAAAALREARDAYRVASSKIEAADTTIFRKATGLAENEDAGAIVDRIAGGKFSPQQIKSTCTLLDAHHPEIAQQVRAATLNQMFEPATGEGTVRQFAGVLNSNKNLKTLRALYANDPETIGKVMKLREMAERYTPKEALLSLKNIPVVGKEAGEMLERVKMAREILHDGKAMATLLATRDGVDATLRFVRPGPVKLTAQAATRILEISGESQTIH